MTGRLSRREMLGVLGGIGTGALAAGFAPIAFPEADAAEPGPKRQWAMVIDLRKCDGCKKCTEACQAEHELPAIKAGKLHHDREAELLTLKSRQPAGVQN